MMRKDIAKAMNDNAKQAVDDLMKIYNWCLDLNVPRFPMKTDELATLCLVAADLITSLSIAAEKASVKAALCDEAIAAGARAQKELERAKSGLAFWKKNCLEAEARLQARQEAEDEFMLCHYGR